MKKTFIALVFAYGAALFAAEPALSSPELQADMKKQEEAMAAIQKGMLYSNKEAIAEGVKQLKEANKAGTLKDSMQTYLPANKKAFAKQAVKMGEDVNKNADLLLADLKANKYGEAFDAYGKILNSCNACHLIVRGWR